MLEIDQILPEGYRIQKFIGQGGTGRVYLAVSLTEHTTWAIKEIPKEGIPEFSSVREQMLGEIRLLQKLDHPGLPRVREVLETESALLVVMDYIPGIPLDRLLATYGPQPQELVVEWAKELCEVLSYLHGRSPAIIYRDMKPSNIMLKPDGSVALIDFGTAREFKESHGADTTCLGTMGYAAPEQYGGMGQSDERTDIYTLGATLSHLLTGRMPCISPYGILPIRQEDPLLSPGLEQIILKCTRFRPRERYESCERLLEALEHYQELEEHLEPARKKGRIFLPLGKVRLPGNLFRRKGTRVVIEEEITFVYAPHEFLRYPSQKRDTHF